MITTDIKKEKITYNPRLSGFMVSKSLNFEIVQEGYVDISKCPLGLIHIEDYDEICSHFYFRGDLCDRYKILPRLKQEGYADLAKELEDLLQQLDIKNISKAFKKDLKKLYGLKTIIFYADLTSLEKQFVSLHNVVTKKEVYDYDLKVGTCKNSYGMYFPSDFTETHVKVEDLILHQKQKVMLLDATKSGRKLLKLLSEDTLI